tara:strand:- start:496 stop:753 length:258 start_codon:yes stop_codon:yes gene_type:complete
LAKGDEKMKPPKPRTKRIPLAACVSRWAPYAKTHESRQGQLPKEKYWPQGILVLTYLAASFSILPALHVKGNKNDDLACLKNPGN